MNSVKSFVGSYGGSWRSSHEIGMHCICYFRTINFQGRCSGTGRRTMRGEGFTGDIDDKEKRRTMEPECSTVMSDTKEVQDLEHTM